MKGKWSKWQNVEHPTTGEKAKIKIRQKDDGVDVILRRENPASALNEIANIIKENEALLNGIKLYPLPKDEKTYNNPLNSVKYLCRNV